MKFTPVYSVAVLGPKNTYSDLAAQKYAGEIQETIYCDSIADVFEMVESGRAKQGVVPLENMIYGTVRETLDELYKKNVHIVAKFNLPIRHALVAMPGARKKEIITISSHDQALAQCRIYIRKHFPRARLLQTASTMAAFDTIIGEHDTSAAAIIPYEIARKLDCAILADKIVDNPQNRTTFIAIKKGAVPRNTPAGANEGKGSPRTSIAFAFGKDRPGALSEIFREFAEAKINLSHIESRPSPEEFGKYVFYMDFLGHPEEDCTKKVLKNISGKVAKLKILGVY